MHCIQNKLKPGPTINKNVVPNGGNLSTKNRSSNSIDLQKVTLRLFVSQGLSLLLQFPTQSVLRVMITTTFQGGP